MRRFLVYLVVLIISGIWSLSFPKQAQASHCNPTRPAPMRIFSGQSASGYICPQDQQDVYYFTANAGSRVTIHMTQTDHILRPEIWLMSCCSGDGRIYQIQRGGSQVELRQHLPYTGTYAIRAGSAGFSSTGGYNLWMQFR